MILRHRAIGGPSCWTLSEELRKPFSFRFPLRSIRTLEDMRDVLLAGAEKVSVQFAAVLKPEIIQQERGFWKSSIVLGMDVKTGGRHR